MTPEDHKRLQRLRALARLMDSAIRVPGLNWRIGLDSLIGLAPGVGDAAGFCVSAYALLEARRLGAPATLLLRMGLNIALDAVVGSIPLVGDLFDAGFKANRRNLRLLERHLAKTVGDS